MYREFDPLEAANNALVDENTYAQRANVESVFFALRQLFGQKLSARSWFGKFREIVLKVAVRNVGLSLSISNA